MSNDHDHYTIPTEVNKKISPSPSAVKHKCSIRSCKKILNTAGHLLPKDKLRRRRWLKSLKLKEADIIIKGFKICSGHFNENDYMKYANKDIKRRLTLKPGAVPKLQTYEKKAFDYCCVPQCTSVGNKLPILHDGKRILFHKFPEDENVKRQWLSLLKFNETTTVIEKNQCVCSKHFSQTDYLTKTKGNIKLKALKRLAVPKKNLPDALNFVGIADNIPPTVIPRPFDVPKGKNTCSIFGCNQKQDTHSLTKLFPLPICNPKMPPSYQHIEKKRRQAWLDSIECDIADGESIQICGKHFNFGIPANVLNYCHVDWVPTLFVGKHKETKSAILFKEYDSYANNMGRWLFEDFYENYYQENCEDQQSDETLVELPINALVSLEVEPDLPLASVNFDENEKSPEKNPSPISSTTTPTNFKTIVHRNKEITLKTATPSLNTKKNRFDNSNYSDSSSDEENYFPDNTWGTILSLNDGDIIFKLVSKCLDEPIQCSICKKKFDNNTTYFQHKLSYSKCLIVHGKCEICDDELPTDDNNELSQHFLNHLFPRDYYCKFCRRQECGSIIEQYEHLLLKTGQKYYICATCGNAFHNNDQLWEHINESHNMDVENVQKNRVNIFNKTKESKKSTNNTTATTTTSVSGSDATKQGTGATKQCSGATKQQCDVCGVMVSNVHSHIETHYQTRKYKCELCNSSFLTQRYLSKHQQSHNKVAHKCEICEKEFYWLETLSGHMRKVHPTDNSDQLFACEHCYRKFRYKSVRDAHQNAHPTYKCEICNETFRFYPKLCVHMKHHRRENEKEIKMNRKMNELDKKCERCNTSFVSVRAKKNHVHVCKGKINSEKTISSSKSSDIQTYVKTKTIIIKTNELSSVNNENLIPSSEINDRLIKKLILKPVQFICKQCNKCFRKETDCVQHKIDVHRKKFRCKTCGELTENIISHMRDHRYCVSCNVEFNSVAALQEHKIKNKCQ